ncbi:MAG TPA: hypothetical protein VD999_06090 [Vitreimonas sp.]|nr:hypothetical protein [Vitreimonas sp.]
MKIDHKHTFVDGYNITTCEYKGETYYLYEVEIRLAIAQRTVKHLLFYKQRPSEKYGYTPAVLPDDQEVVEDLKIPKVVRK